jgi:hypothetical protein
VFTILTDYGSYLVDGSQVERLNAAKRARAGSVHLDVLCHCAQPHHATRRVEIALNDVVGVIGHKPSNDSKVVPFGRMVRSA